MADGNDFGSEFSLWDKLRLLQEWAPVLTYVQAFLATEDEHEKALVIAQACKWLASKSPDTTVDDELVEHVTRVLRSKEGEDFLRWIVDKVVKESDENA